MPHDAQPRVLIIDDDANVRELVDTVLSHAGYKVISAQSGEEGFGQAIRTPPDLIISDVVLPGIDGYTLCKRLRQHPATRYVPILMLTSQDDISAKVAGFEAGANDYITKPFAPQELPYRVKNLLARVPAPSADDASSKGRAVLVFGTKGGVGKTTLSVNLALVFRLRTKKRVALFDADFHFGDISVHLNLSPTRTVIDLVERIEDLDQDLLSQVMMPHPSGIHVLLSPFRPEEAELVKAEHVGLLMESLVRNYDYVVVDCQASYDERMLVALEHADTILLVVTPEIGPLKNTSLFLDLAEKLGLSSKQIYIVLNRANSNVGIDIAEIERALKHPVSFQIVSGGRPVVFSANRGVPLIASQPKHPFAQQVIGVADSLIKTLTLDK